ncbi:MAG: hypothetical protein R3C39_16450 [Dehalococcoidia bacterium]
MFQPPQESGTYDSEAEAKRRAERMNYPSIWVELWYITLGVVRLPMRLWRAVRRR